MTGGHGDVVLRALGYDDQRNFTIDLFGFQNFDEG